MDKYTLHLGDCLEVMKALPDASIDCICTDPPYGTTACKWDSVIPFAPMWEQLKRLIKPKGAIVLFGSQPFTSALIMSNPKWFRYEDIWEKSRATGYHNVSRQSLKSHENIVVFSEGEITYNPQKWKIDPIFWERRNRVNPTKEAKAYGGGAKTRWRENGERYPLSIISVASESSMNMHPTQKPVALMEYLIKTYTNEGDTVLDFTFGSGSTGVAAIKAGRRFIGIEREPEYFEIARRRIEEVANPAQLAMAVAV